MDKFIKFIIYAFINVLVVQNISGKDNITEQSFPKNHNDTLEKIYQYYNIAVNLKDDSLSKAIWYNKKALKLANTIHSMEACGITNELMGELFQKSENIQPAINYYLISVKIYTEQNNQEKLSILYGKLGLLYYNNNYYTERTMSYYNKSLEYAIKINNKALIAEAYNRIGGLFFNQNNLQDAFHYFSQAEKIFTDINQDKGMAICYNNIGEIYRLNGDLAKAEEYYRKSIKINKKCNYKLLSATNYENMGQIYSTKGNFDKAFDYYYSSLDLYNNINDINAISNLYIILGNQYLKLNKVNQATSTLQKAYNISIKNNFWEQIKQSAEGLSKIYEQTKHYKEALKFANIYSQYNDSIIKKQMNDQIKDIQSHFKQSIKEKEIIIKDADIVLLENRNEINNLRKNIIILGVIILFVLTALTVIRLRHKIKKEKLDSKRDRELHKIQNDLLKIEIENKDNDLTNFALHLVQKNELLRQLKYDLGKLYAHNNDELNRKIKELSMHVQQSLQINKDIVEFQNKVELAYDDFFIRLKAKFPSLTNNEKRLCALLRLNLSTKEIASLNNTSVKAVEMGRYRLRKKFGIDKGKSLFEYFQNI